MTQNQINYQSLLENTRANKAREGETNRANLAQEELKRRELIEANRHNLVSEGETHRSNVARESEANRSNLAKELETNRHNLATENISAVQAVTGQQQVGLGYSQLAETSRANQVRERETERSNRASESNQISVANINALSQRTVNAMKEAGANYRARLASETSKSVAITGATAKALGGLGGTFATLMKGLKK